MGKAILWLTGGLLIGLVFADRSDFVHPTTAGGGDPRVQSLNQDMHRLEIENPTPAQLENAKFLSGKGLKLEVYYEIPDSDQLPYLQALDGDGNAKTAETLLSDSSKLNRKVRFVENKTGLSSLKIEEPFMIWFKAGLIVGAVIASPMIFYHLWSFVAAGLHSHERTVRLHLFAGQRCAVRLGRRVGVFPGAALRVEFSC